MNVANAYVLMFFLASCATSGGSAPAEGLSASLDSASPAGLRMAKIVPQMPEGAIDLGPVLVSDARKTLSPQDLLLVEGDRLGADGFVAEGRGVQDVYTFTQSWRERHPVSSVATTVILALLNGGVPIQNSTAPSNVERVAFYRAYRLALDAPGPADAGATVIPPAQREGFAAAKSLGEQLSFANALVASAVIDAGTYEEIRSYLLQAWQAASSKDS